MEQNRTSILQMARGAIQEIVDYFEDKLGDLNQDGRVVVLR